MIMTIPRGSDERAEAEHLERLAAVAAELEATRQRLAQMNEAPTIEPVGRRVFQWMIPMAATALVAFVGILAFGGESAASPARADSEIEPNVPVVEVEPEPIATPEPVLVAETPTPEPVVAPKPVRPKNPKNPKKPPLIINPSGDPLG
jgi:outer membrane biosynthesis protein TonB